MCLFGGEIYIVPRISFIPSQLFHLLLSEICALHPFHLHCGDYCKREHGYRQKTSMCRLSVSNHSVGEKIVKGSGWRAL